MTQCKHFYSPYLNHKGVTVVKCAQSQIQSYFLSIQLTKTKLAIKLGSEAGLKLNACGTLYRPRHSYFGSRCSGQIVFIDIICMGGGIMLPSVRVTCQANVTLSYSHKHFLEQLLGLAN